jgi:hypothetical protein
MSMGLLKQELEAFTKPTCRLTPAGQPIHTLTSSKRQVFASCPRIHSTISLRTFTHLTRLGRAGVYKAAVEVDKCEVCSKFDKSLMPEIQKFKSDTERQIISIAPSFFDGCEEVDISDDASLARWGRFVRDRHETDASFRCLLRDDAVAKLEDTNSIGPVSVATSSLSVCACLIRFGLVFC